jgi:hypothetical protein
MGYRVMAQPEKYDVSDAVHNTSTVYKNLSATARAGSTDRPSQHTNHPVQDTLLQLSWVGHRVG